MLAIQKCREIIGTTAISDSELEQLRNALYSIAGLIIDQTVEGNEENRINN